MTPFYFNQCFGWLHSATGNRGVVICSAMGVEELCTHRFMRKLANEIAAAGMPALRFDYQGTGDSRGDDGDPDRVAHWLASIREAVAWLRRETGVTEVALAGFRLGTLLATQVAAELGEVQRLVLMGAVSSGKNYLREVKALSALLAQSARTAVPASHASAAAQDGFEAVGFQLTDATIAELNKLDLLNLPTAPAAQVLLLNRAQAAVDSRLAACFQALGSEITQMELPGYADMEWNSTFATLPEDAFAGLITWLGRDLRADCAIAPSVPDQALVADDWRESPQFFGADQNLFAIHCQPLREAKRTVVLFINHGANHHIGWARTYVTLARHFTRQGIASLRMDLAGIGDSPPHSGQAENQLYKRGSLRDIQAALNWLYSNGYESCTVIGHCAGAYQGFYAALRDPRITGLVMLNLQCFFWRRGDSVEIAMRESYRASHWYFAMLRDPKSWRRLLSLDINVSGISRALLRRALERGRAFFINHYGHWFGHEGNSRKILRWFRELARRKTKVLLVYSSEDSGLDELFLHTGSAAKKLRKFSNVRLHTIDGADHNLTPAWSREIYAKVLDDYLSQGSQRATARLT